MTPEERASLLALADRIRVYVADVCRPGRSDEVSVPSRVLEFWESELRRRAADAQAGDARPVACWRYTKDGKATSMWFDGCVPDDPHAAKHGIGIEVAYTHPAKGTEVGPFNLYTSPMSAAYDAREEQATPAGSPPLGDVVPVEVAMAIVFVAKHCIPDRKNWPIALAWARDYIARSNSRPSGESGK